MTIISPLPAIPKWLHLLPATKFRQHQLYCEGFEPEPRCYDSGQPLSGSERFRLRGIDGRYHVEAKKVNIGEELCVLSLLQRYDV